MIKIQFNVKSCFYVKSLTIQSGTQITSLNLKRLSAQPFVYRLYMNASSQTVQRSENNFIVSRWCAISQNSRNSHIKNWLPKLETMVKPQKACSKIKSNTCSAGLRPWNLISHFFVTETFVGSNVWLSFANKRLCANIWSTLFVSRTVNKDQNGLLKKLYFVSMPKNFHVFKFPEAKFE